MSEDALILRNFCMCFFIFPIALSPLCMVILHDVELNNTKQHFIYHGGLMHYDAFPLLFWLILQDSNH
jgi:hypothetical protein